MKRRLLGNLITLATACAFIAGCQSGPNRSERFGKTFFVDGAGNWGGSGARIAQGLYEAGYRGDVEEFVWTTSLNPLVDQLNIIAAKIRAHGLARRIKAYRARYPNQPINIIALSAGTGIATWAVEQLHEKSKINQMVFLASSLSHDYDMTRALSHMTGNIRVYHSDRDAVLQAVKFVGTIDGKRGVNSVGAVGLTPPDGLENRIVNVPWNSSWHAYRWRGGHLDCTNTLFVRAEITRHLAGPFERPARVAGATLSSTVIPDNSAR